MDSFVSMFELVFDLDWSMTQVCIENSEYLIDDKGTFLQPLVDDESNNWANRGALLETYRHLLQCMKNCGIQRERSW